MQIRVKEAEFKCFCEPPCAKTVQIVGFMMLCEKEARAMAWELLKKTSGSATRRKPKVHYTESEVQQLRQLYLSGKAPKEIATIMNRPSWGIHSKIHKLRKAGALYANGSTD